MEPTISCYIGQPLAPENCMTVNGTVFAVNTIDAVGGFRFDLLEGDLQLAWAFDIITGHGIYTVRTDPFDMTDNQRSEDCCIAIQKVRKLVICARWGG